MLCRLDLRSRTDGITERIRAEERRDREKEGKSVKESVKRGWLTLSSVSDTRTKFLQPAESARAAGEPQG